MPTVKELAQQAAAGGVTRERFHQILAGLGVDSYTASPDQVVEQAYASMPAEPHEFGGAHPSLAAPEPVRFDVPAVYGATAPPPPTPPQVLGVPMPMEAGIVSLTPPTPQSRRWSPSSTLRRRRCGSTGCLRHGLSVRLGLGRRLRLAPSVSFRARSGSKTPRMWQPPGAPTGPSLKPPYHHSRRGR